MKTSQPINIKQYIPPLFLLDEQGKEFDPVDLIKIVAKDLRENFDEWSYYISSLMDTISYLQKQVQITENIRKHAVVRSLLKSDPC